MRKTIQLCGLALLASTFAVGCGGSDKTVIRRETVQTIPPPAVVQKQTTVETVPAAPIVEQRTTVRSGSVERTIETDD
jgi:hypothetical protein